MLERESKILVFSTLGPQTFLLTDIFMAVAKRRLPQTKRYVPSKLWSNHTGALYGDE